MREWVLSIDFGTTNTVSAMAYDDHVEPLEIEGARRLRSLVVVSPEGDILVGRAAAERAAVEPGRAEMTPKRRLGGPPLLLGDRSVDATDAAAAVLRYVYGEALRQRSGVPPASTWLTHPAGWAEARLSALREAGRRAGLPNVGLLPEPVAAAIHYSGGDIAPGRHVAVYDLGGGTFDTTVLRRTETGFEISGQPGGDPEIGGEEFDHRIVVHLGEILGVDDPSAWERIRQPGDDRSWQQVATRFRDAARDAKESLSTVTSAQVYVPAPVDRDLRITRPEFESLVRDDIEKTARILQTTIHDAGIGDGEVDAIYLVGGSSRIPIVPEIVESHLQGTTVTLDEPKVVTALGAARHGAAIARAATPAAREPSVTTTSALVPAPPPAAPTPPAPAEPAVAHGQAPVPVGTPQVPPPTPGARPPTPTPGGGGGEGNRALTVVAIVVGTLVLLAAAGTALFVLRDSGRKRAEPTTTTTTEPPVDTFANLGIGDCFDAQIADVVDAVEETDCSEEHEFEVFDIVHFSEEEGLPMPSSEEFAAECESTFEDYVGSTPEETTLEISWFAPIEENWDDGTDRSIICYVGGWYEPLTFSLQDSGY